jgi:hypothetical protein
VPKPSHKPTIASSASVTAATMRLLIVPPAARYMRQLPYRFVHYVQEMRLNYDVRFSPEGEARRVV